ncbi:MAG: insulinase family protein [Candidatus Obscuribacter sp.]|nr:insulinase family protein [Candidatus Obscuribacter sp.]
MKTQTDMVSNERLSALGLTLIKERNGISEYKLNANGLKILLIPNQSSQAATVMIVYRVGSRNEAVGYTGSTHFLEHMMFKGTDRFPNFDGVLTPLGADYNATTSYDRTNYFAKVPTEHVGKVIALEADRMRNLNLRQDHRNSEMTVVRNEFENGKNSPFSVLIEQLGATAFDAHPYHHPIIGWLSDVENVPLARLKAFYDEFYWPNNATVMVTGNYGTDDDVLKTIVDEFGAIPASPHAIPEVYTVEAPQLGERRFVIEQESTDPAVVVMGFRVPGAAHKDSAALDVIAGMLGSSSRMASRLYQSLVETGLAVEAFIWPNTQRDEYLLRIGAIPTPGTTLEQLEEALMAQLNKLAREEASPEELAKVKKASRKSRLLGADSQMSLVSKICEMEVASSWEFYLDYDALIDAVTAQDVRDVASRYFVKKNRTTGHFLPQQSVADQPTGDEAKALPDTSTAARASLTAGLVEKVLDNGFKIQVLPLEGAGTVGVSIKLRAGDHFAPADKPLVPTLVAEMLTKGAKHLNLSQMAAILEEMGTRIGFGTDKLAVSCSGKVVGEDFAAYIKILADCLKNPLFPAAQLAQVKEQMRANLSQGLSDPDSIASVTMSQKLFAEGSFHREHSAEELLASLDAITVDDLKAFHKAYYGPRSALITVTGDVQADSAMQAIEHVFRKWESGFADTNLDIATAAAPAKAEVVRVAVPAKTSVSIKIGLPLAAKIGTPEYFVAKLANDALGENTLSARLGLVVREKHGLTYGIRCYFEGAQYGDGLWQIGLTVNPANVDKALSLVEEVVKQYLAEGISDEELKTWAQNTVGGFQIALDNPLAIARSLNNYSFLGLPTNYMDTLAAGYHGVTTQAVNDYIRKNFDPSKMLTVVVGTFK